MNANADLETYLKEIQKRFSREMPRILKEIKVYEDKLAAGTLTQNPVPGPQFDV